MIASGARKIDIVTRHLRFSPSKPMDEIGRLAGVSPSYVSQINRDLKIRTQTKAGPRANISEMEALALADLQAAPLEPRLQITAPPCHSCRRWAADAGS